MPSQIVNALVLILLAAGLAIPVGYFVAHWAGWAIFCAGLGLQTTPANLILISLALFMTFYVMEPTFDRA